MEVLARGLQVPEGPAMLGDGTVVFTEQLAGRISSFDGTHVEVVAVTGGAPNSCVAGETGLYVCQNGGVVGSWRSEQPQPPGIQRVHPSGEVALVRTNVAGRDLVTPNDLVFSPDGQLWFTDPSQPFDPANRLDEGCLHALSGCDDDVRLDVGGVYCNGIGISPDGDVLWVESYTRRVRRLTPEGEAETLCTLPEGHVPDGFAVGTDGRIFIATCASHGISVIAPDGEYLGLLHLDADAFPTNCCFDGANLLVTDFGVDFETTSNVGRLWRVPTDAQGAPVHRGSL